MNDVYLAGSESEGNYGIYTSFVLASKALSDKFGKLEVIQEKEREDGTKDWEIEAGEDGYYCYIQKVPLNVKVNLFG